MEPSEPGSGLASDRQVDSATVLAIAFVLLAAVVMASWVPASVAGSRPVSAIIATSLGGFVGLAELVSRYRDRPWRVARSAPGIWFIAMNAVAGGVALFVLQASGQDFGAFNPWVAGFGAMVVLRSRLASIRSAGGAEVEVGPAFLVTTLLSAVNREADRLRAVDRMEIVTEAARQLSDTPFNDALPHIMANLLAFQGLDAQERKELADRLNAYATDQTLKQLPDSVRYRSAFFDLLTAFGDTAFGMIVKTARDANGWRRSS